MRLLIKQARIVAPGSVHHNQITDILIEQGFIKKIAATINVTADHFIEEPNLCISAGFIDLFADYREPGQEHKETLASGRKAAAAGGYTQVCLLPNTQPIADNKGAIQQTQKNNDGQVVKLLPLGAATQQCEGKALAEMMDMQQAGAVAFTDGWRPIQQSSLLLKALEYVKSFDGLLIQMPVEQTLTSGTLMHEGIVSTGLGMPGVPDIAETLAVHQAITLLRYTNSKIHLTGVSSAKAIAQIRAAKQEGLAITCSVTPYHLSLTDEALRGYDSNYKTSPPLRTEQDRQALIAGLKEGTIDAIASHHRPQDWDAKQKEFDYAGEGMNVQQYAFCIAYDAVKNEVPLERFIDALTVSPRQILGLEQVLIQDGASAQLVLYVLDQPTLISDDNNYSLSANNPFLATQKSGRILATINGKALYRAAT